MKCNEVYGETLLGLLALSRTLVISIGLVGMGPRVPTVGMQAEDFRLADLDGESQTLSQY